MPNVMTALPNIGGARGESSLIPFLVPRRSLAHVHCSSANIGQGKTWTQSEFCTWQHSLRGQESRKMYIQRTSPGDGQTACKVWLASGEWRRCSNEANKRNRLKFAGVPQSGKPISAANGPKFTILWDMRRIYCSLTFFFDCRYICLSCKVQRDDWQSCAMVPRWRIFGDFFAFCIFSEPHAAQFRPAF